jgi:hypothetical protein
MPVALRISSFLVVAAALSAGVLRGERGASEPAAASQDAARRTQPSPVPAIAPPPERLSATGLYVPGGTSLTAPGVLAYVPQYPLWSDGATKRRWVALPPGGRIDASNPDGWVFPVGTRFWKEFSFAERAETRMIERLADGSFRYATYVWDAEQGEAFLAPEGGARAVTAIAGDVAHDVPGVGDCRACHEGRTSTVLGFGALQLSTDRDALAANAERVEPGAVDLAELVRRGLLVNFPDAWRARPPRIVASTPLARAASGYLFGNCAHCHNASGPLAGLALDLDQSVVDDGSEARVLASLVGRASRYRPPGMASLDRVSAEHPRKSALWLRMASRAQVAQMPPLGTKVVDPAGLELVRRWIHSAPTLLSHNKGSER